MNDKKIALQYHIPAFFLFLIFFLSSLTEVVSFDFWLHLKAGEWIISNLNIPRQQLFSYAIGPAAWIDHSWLFQAIIFLIYKYGGGINSLIILRGIMLVLPMYLAFKSIARKVSIYWLIPVAALCFHQVIKRPLLRPELFSMFFLGAYLYLLIRRSESRKIYLIIPLQILWVNMHGYSIIGPGLMGIFLLSELIKAKVRLPFEWNQAKRVKSDENFKRLVSVFLLSIAVFIFNPYLLKGVLYPLYAVKEIFIWPRTAYHTVQELLPFSIYNIVYRQDHLTISAIIFLFFLALITHIKKFDIFNLFIFLSFGSLALFANRNIGMFGIVSAFSILNTLNTKGNYTSLSTIFQHSKHIRHFLRAFGLILIFALVVIYLFPIHLLYGKYYVYGLSNVLKKRAFGVCKISTPEGASNFITENNIKGPIFNNFNMGAYLAWKLYPEHKIFIDGRTEVYGKDFLKDYYDALTDFDKWLVLDDKYSFNVVVLNHYYSDSCYGLIYNLYKHKDWSLVYFDRGSFIFLKYNEDNQKLIKKYQIDLEDFKDMATMESVLAAKAKKAYPYDYLLSARFFIKAMDMPSVALAELNKVEIIDPGLYELYQLKGYAYFEKGDYDNAYKAFYRSALIRPDIPEPYVNLGYTCGKLGLLDESIVFYKEALSIEPRDKRVRESVRLLEEAKANERSGTQDVNS
ncbi:MAG: hypothetical protein ABH843_02845 [Candidatus Omnitrophota bacterium]